MRSRNKEEIREERTNDKPEYRQNAAARSGRDRLWEEVTDRWSTYWRCAPDHWTECILIKKTIRDTWERNMICRSLESLAYVNVNHLLKLVEFSKFFFFLPSLFSVSLYFKTILIIYNLVKNMTHLPTWFCSVKYVTHSGEQCPVESAYTNIMKSDLRY